VTITLAEDRVPRQIIRISSLPGICKKLRSVQPCRLEMCTVARARAVETHTCNEFAQRLGTHTPFGCWRGFQEGEL